MSENYTTRYLVVHSEDADGTLNTTHPSADFFINLNNSASTIQNVTGVRLVSMSVTKPAKLFSPNYFRFEIVVAGSTTTLDLSDVSTTDAATLAFLNTAFTGVLVFSIDATSRHLNIQNASGGDITLSVPGDDQVNTFDASNRLTTHNSAQGILGFLKNTTDYGTVSAGNNVSSPQPVSLQDANSSLMIHLFANESNMSHAICSERYGSWGAIATVDWSHVEPARRFRPSPDFGLQEFLPFPSGHFVANIRRLRCQILNHHGQILPLLNLRVTLNFEFQCLNRALQNKVDLYNR